MNLHRHWSDNQAANSDEMAMERSKSFINALQELKSLRPQLYSAAEYCEKSYYHTEQKQMVFENLKDYAVRAVVNAVDHLGTVASKLTDVLEQQTMDFSTIELKVSCVSQKLLRCQIFLEKEALRQQQLFAIIPRHHKHYILPNTVNKKVHFGLHVHANAKQNPVQARLRLRPSVSPAANTLSWHMASETKSTLKGNSIALMSLNYPKTNGVFQLSSDVEENTSVKALSDHLRRPSGGHAYKETMNTVDIARKDLSESAKPMKAFKSFENPSHEIVRAPIRNKSIFSSFFAMQKPHKLKITAVS